MGRGQNCCVPECRTKYKQGLMLFSFPKDPQKKENWLLAFRNAGLELKKLRAVICELHFGPTQWEKIRVDGTKKLKISAVPNAFTAEAVAECLELAREVARQPITGSPGIPLNLCKPREHVMPLPLLPKPSDSVEDITDVDSELMCDENPIENVEDLLVPVSNQGGDLQHSGNSLPPSVPTIPIHLTFSTVGSIPSSSNYATPHDPQATLVLQVSQVPSVPQVSSVSQACAPLVSSVSSVHTTHSAPTSFLPPCSLPSISRNVVQPSTFECLMSLSDAGHSIILKVPKSRYQNSLAEDLDDVATFMNETERTYEERLINALSELMKKHEVLDKKIKEAEAMKLENENFREKLGEYEKVLDIKMKATESYPSENCALKVKLEDLKDVVREAEACQAENDALKEKLISYEKVSERVLVENYNLKSKLQKFEQMAAVENVFRQNTVINVENVSSPVEILPDKTNIYDKGLVKWVSPFAAMGRTNSSSNAFSSLDDQL